VICVRLVRATSICQMDVAAFVATHRGTWDRLESLVKHRRRLSGAEIDELVELYQKVSTHLSAVRSASGDPALVGRLSTLVARARSAVTAEHAPLWRQFVRFWTVSFPVVAYRSWRWWLGATIGSAIVAVVVGVWVAHSPELQAVIGTPAEIDKLVNEDFANYYREHPAGSFALHVWLNNSWVAAQCVIFAVLLGIPIPYVLYANAVNVGVSGGLMISAGKGGIFFGLLAPHGILELTAIFLAAGAGMRLGWTVVDPGHRPRGQALAEQGRAVTSVAGGLVVVLLVSGLIEALVTPSSLPTFARIGIGVVAEVLFLAYVIVLGRRGVAANESGDIEDAPDYVPAA
jgi:uncharacterized membrane protein SpoIIM required for sporulation